MSKISRVNHAGEVAEYAAMPRRQELIAQIHRYGREESRLSVLFRELIARRFGISAGDAECIDFLLEKGSATAGELASASGLTTGAITGMISRLKKARLITVNSDPQDLRRVILKPVMKQVRRGLRLYQSFGKELDSLFESYSLEELALLATHYRRMSEILSKEIKALGENASD